VKPRRDATLQSLSGLRAALRAAEQAAAERAASEAAAAAAAALQAERRAREASLFRHTVGAVQPVRARARADVARPRPAPEPVQRQRDEQAALREALSDEVDIESLLLTDDGLSFRRAGIGPDVLTKLRRGHWSIQGELDLHGLRRDDARDAVGRFVRSAHERGLRCLRVVHGKGHGSPGKAPVLKGKVQRWLAQRSEVVAFAQAAGPQGGAGALIVLLTAGRRGG
jgi:DNA-nicking Smr family endonuclease